MPACDECHYADLDADAYPCDKCSDSKHFISRESIHLFTWQDAANENQALRQEVLDLKRDNEYLNTRLDMAFQEITRNKEDIGQLTFKLDQLTKRYDGYLSRKDDFYFYERNQHNS